MTVTLPSGSKNAQLDHRIDTCRELLDGLRLTVAGVQRILAHYQEMNFIQTRAFNHAEVHVEAAWRALGYADEYLKEAHS